MIYPYRIRVTDPVIIDRFMQVSKKGFSNVNPNEAKKIGRKIPRSIKRDGVIIKGGVFAVYNRRIKLDYETAYGKRKGYDFIFKSLF